MTLFFKVLTFLILLAPGYGLAQSRTEDLKKKYEIDILPWQKEMEQKAREREAPTKPKEPINLGGASVPEVVKVYAEDFAKMFPKAINPFDKCTDFRKECWCSGIVFKPFPKFVVKPMKYLRQPTDLIDGGELAFQSRYVDSVRMKLEIELMKRIVYKQGFLEQIVQQNLIMTKMILARANIKVNDKMDESHKKAIASILERNETVELVNHASAQAAWCTVAIPLIRAVENPNPMLRIKKKKKGAPGEYAANFGFPYAPMQLEPISGTYFVGGKFKTYMNEFLADPLVCTKYQILNQEGKYKALSVGEPLITREELLSSKLLPAKGCFKDGMGSRAPLGPRRSNTNGDASEKVSACVNWLDAACILEKKYYDVRLEPDMDRIQYLHGQGYQDIEGYECAEIERTPKEFGEANEQDYPLDTLSGVKWTRFSECDVDILLTSTCPVFSRSSCG